MAPLITVMRDGIETDRYTPISNSLACFKGLVDDLFTPYPEHNFFIVYTPLFEHSSPNWHDIMCFFEQHAHQVVKVRAYSSLGQLGEQTFVELSLIHQPKDL